MEILNFRFKKKVGENGNDHNVRLRGQLINKIEIFKYLGLIVQENGEIVEDIVSRIICNRMK